MLHRPIEPAVYTSKAYAELCQQLGIIQSMGAVGTSADNAMAESFNATLKREVLRDAACFTDELSCRRKMFRWRLFKVRGEGERRVAGVERPVVLL